MVECGLLKVAAWSQRGTTLGARVHDSGRGQKGGGLALAPQVQPRSENEVAIWETDHVPPTAVTSGMMWPPPVQPALLALEAHSEHQGLSLSQWDRVRGRADATLPAPFLTARSLMAALLGWMSMNGLLPIPIDTISCILSSKTE